MAGPSTQATHRTWTAVQNRVRRPKRTSRRIPDLILPARLVQLGPQRIHDPVRSEAASATRRDEPNSLRAGFVKKAGEAHRLYSPDWIMRVRKAAWRSCCVCGGWAAAGMVFEAEGRRPRSKGRGLALYRRHLSLSGLSEGSKLSSTLSKSHCDARQTVQLASPTPCSPSASSSVCATTPAHAVCRAPIRIHQDVKVDRKQEASCAEG